MICKAVVLLQPPNFAITIMFGHHRSNTATSVYYGVLSGPSGRCFPKSAPVIVTQWRVFSKPHSPLSIALMSLILTYILSRSVS